jgi:membrane protease YdiL (CAAX protease family)
MENKENDFSNVNILSAIIWFFIAFVFLTSTNSSMPKRYSEGFSEIIMYLTILIWLFYNFKKNNIKSNLVYGKVKNYNQLFIILSVSMILSISSLFIVTTVLTFLSRINLLYVFQNPQTSQRNVIDGPAMLSIVNTVLIAPLVEELFFRGYLLNKLSEKYTVRTALIISTVTFSLAHFQTFWAVLLFGFFLTVVYVKTKSLLISTICHSANNLLFCIMRFCLSTTAFEKLLSYGFVAFIISVPLIIYFLYISWSSSNHVSPYQYNKANL